MLRVYIKLEIALIRNSSKQRASVNGLLECLTALLEYIDLTMASIGLESIGLAIAGSAGPTLIPLMRNKTMISITLCLCAKSPTSDIMLVCNTPLHGHEEIMHAHKKKL